MQTRLFTIIHIGHTMTHSVYNVYMNTKVDLSFKKTVIIIIVLCPCSF